MGKDFIYFPGGGGRNCRQKVSGNDKTEDMESKKSASGQKLPE
jgi:hypothetical protein